MDTFLSPNNGRQPRDAEFFTSFYFFLSKLFIPLYIFHALRMYVVRMSGLYYWNFREFLHCCNF